MEESTSSFKGSQVVGELVRANAFERTFEIETDLGTGTAFVIDRGERQYLITAKHLLPPGNSRPQAEVRNRLVEAELRLDLLRVDPDQADVAVASLEEFLVTQDLPLPAKVDGLAWSQPLFFLGYPYGLATNINSGDPGDRIPFVKSGIWSAAATINGIYTIYVDGHNNPGFSGGPLIGLPPGGTQMQVCGVVAAYRTEQQPVYQGATELTDVSAVANTGIVIATGVQHATAAIDAAR